TAITIPYLSSALESFPLKVYSITAGIGGTSLNFSSKKAVTRSTGWDNAAYMPSDVLNMQGASAVPDNSAFSIDRFWIIDPIGYTTKPSLTLDFTYINAEAAANTSGGSNTITLLNLQAQRWNTTLGTWVDYYPQGNNTNGGSTGTVTGVVVGASDFFRSWTLNDNSAPLPVQLLSFTGLCTGHTIKLHWSSGTETNSHYYTLERSDDGVNYQWVGNVSAAINSTSILNYTLNDSLSPAGLVYYRLSETDLNGVITVCRIIAVSPCPEISTGSDINAYGYDGRVYLNLLSASKNSYTLELWDMCGRLVAPEQLLSVEKGENAFSFPVSVSRGFYLIRIKSNSSVYSRKILLR
ncbi:MAG TPA: T9SS type A sorting domain-containing protein, partial [Bacteroidia bacterium]|nr:T9SS type A sorting domain-containing protein [Bacteroidia bacterium]